MITLDTSAIFALINSADPDHQRVRQVLHAERGPYLVPVGILAEIGYLLEQRLGHNVLSTFLSDIEAGSFSLDCGNEDVRRIRELVARYASLPLGFADACVIACAERNGGITLATDKDFHVVAAERTIRVLP